MLRTIGSWAAGKDHWSFLSWYRDRFGVLPALRAYIDLRMNGGIARAPNTVTGGSVFLRPGTADQAVYHEIFIAREYEIELGAPKFILDAGAHIGLSTVFFACRYPQARIVALEPESSNFAMLLKNTRDYPNVTALQSGLWSKKTHLRVEDSNVPTWSFRVAENSMAVGIPAIGIRDIMSEFETSVIDVAKIDVEGSELEILSNGCDWINHVRTLIIELHDRFRPGCSEALNKVLSGFDCHKTVSGESTVITNICRKAN